MKIFYKKSWLFFCTVLFCGAAFAQQDWPKSITGNNGELIKIYQPQVESYSGNIVKSRSAISVMQDGKTDPVFGAFWWDANVADNGNSVAVQSMQVTNIKFPDGVDDATATGIKDKLESVVPQMNISLSKDELQNSLNSTQQQAKLAGSFNNAAPRVIYTTKPTMLVLIDGEPKLQSNSTYGVDAVVNSPYTIVKNKDGRFYLYGGKQWYSAPAATGPYSSVSDIPENLQQIENAVKNGQNNQNSGNTGNSGNSTNNTGNSDNNGNTNDDAAANNSNVVPDIIVSTTPAELIQSDGEANFAPVENTTLLYVKNSSNDIFMDVNSQQYYVLLSGRWYKAPSLKSQWQYIPADRLPADFAKIPSGSPKDNVLASVAGTDQANEAVMDAAVPQTAKVDRRTATTTVTYDGDPQFENIEGTRLQYAVNASATVLKLHGNYYAVDNGVWFQSNSANGPWQVSGTRPDDVDQIPPSYPVYNSKYVYVYDQTPDYVYTGYTPGYLNTYAYGPTMVYGTGYYYRPWYRHHYYARPYTWGFGMNYTPWYGWGLGYGFGCDWFDIGFGFGSWWGGGYSYGGWWGPSIYRPAFGFGGGYYHNYGYYGYNRGFGYGNRSGRYGITYHNNIYNGRRNVYTTNRSFVNNGRYANNNRGGAFNGNRNGGNRFNNGGNRFNNGGGNRTGTNPGYNGGRLNNGGRVNSNGSSYNNRYNGGNRIGNNGSNATPGGRSNNTQGQNRGYNQQAPARQYNPQRSTGNNSYSRPQQQQRSAPAPSYGGGGGRSYGGGGGGGSRGGSSGGGGGSRGGGGGGGRHGR